MSHKIGLKCLFAFELALVALLVSSVSVAQPKRATSSYRVVLDSSATLVVVPERSPRTSDRQVCWRRPLEQGRGSVLVCDTVRGGK